MLRVVVVAYVAGLALGATAPTPKLDAEQRLHTDWAFRARYREANVALPAAGKRPRIVFMGDSVTEGWVGKDPAFFSAGRAVAIGHHRVDAVRRLLQSDVGRLVSYLMDKRSHLEASYARTLLPLARSWRQAADRALANLDVSASCGWALVQVGRLGDNVRQTDLARELDITGPSLVRLLDQLAATGMIERRADKADGRVSRVSLTTSGETMLTTIEAALADLRHDILSGLSDAELTNALAVARHVEDVVGRQRSAT